MVNMILLQLYADGAFGIPTVTPNLALDVSRLDLWARFQLMPTSTYRGNLRDIERAGILQITLFVPIGTDDTLINAKAYAIAQHFDTEKSHNVEATDFKGLGFASVTRYANKLEFAKNPIFVQVLIMSSHIETAMPDSDGKWFMTPISVEYEIV